MARKKFSKLWLLVIGGALIYFIYNYSTADFNKDSEVGIQFHRGSWDEAIQLAKKENKPVFLDIYATWCGPCKKLKSNTFSNKNVGELYNQNFINVSFDGEKGDGAMLAQRFGLRAYPTLYFITPDGQIMGQTSGYYEPKELIVLGQKVMKTLK